MSSRCTSIDKMNQEAGRGEAVLRLRAWSLFAVLVLGFVWQTVHYYPSFRLHVRSVDSAAVIQKPEASGFHLTSSAECLICKLRGQTFFSAATAAPEADLSIAAAGARPGVFGRTASYLSSLISSTGARGPPASLLS